MFKLKKQKPIELTRINYVVEKGQSHVRCYLNSDETGLVCVSNKPDEKPSDFLNRMIYSVSPTVNLDNRCVVDYQNLDSHIAIQSDPYGALRLAALDSEFETAIYSVVNEHYRNSKVKDNKHLPEPNVDLLDPHPVIPSKMTVSGNKDFITEHKNAQEYRTMNKIKNYNEISRFVNVTTDLTVDLIENGGVSCKRTSCYQLDDNRIVKKSYKTDTFEYNKNHRGKAAAADIINDVLKSQGQLEKTGRPVFCDITDVDITARNTIDSKLHECVIKTDIKNSFILKQIAQTREIQGESLDKTFGEGISEAMVCAGNQSFSRTSPALQSYHDRTFYISQHNQFDEESFDRNYESYFSDLDTMEETEEEYEL